MPRNNLNECQTLEQHVALTNKVFATAKSHFPGFTIPKNVTAEHAVAMQLVERLREVEERRSRREMVRLATRAFTEVRSELENLLAGFFRNSKQYFRARLKALRVSNKLRPMLRDIYRMLKHISRYSQAAWIEVSVAANLYSRAYAKVVDLECRQRAFERTREHTQEIASGRHRSRHGRGLPIHRSFQPAWG